MGIFQSGVFVRPLVPVSTATGAAGVPWPTSGTAGAPTAPRAPVLIAYATQTGAAEGYAQATQEQLQKVGIDTRLVEFYDLTLATLAETRAALFVASTTYDGDPPDMAEEFCRGAMAQPAALAQLHFGLLALGDSDYDVFCGFGRRLNRWLLASGAQPLFAPVEVDDEDADALDAWFRTVGTCARTCVPARVAAA